MKLIFDFTEEKFVDLCARNVQRKGTTVSQDLYEAIAYFLSTSFDQGLNITEIKHTYRIESYDKHLSLQDYLRQGFIEFYYPKIDVYSKKKHPLAIDTVVLPDFIRLISVSYGFGASRTIKVKEQNLKTKNKIAIELLHLRIGNNIIRKIIERTQGKVSSSLQPSQLAVWEWRQTFYNKIDGEVYFCKCFESAIRKKGSRLRAVAGGYVDDSEYISSQEYMELPEHVKDHVKKHGNGAVVHEHVARAINANSFKEAICHLCTKTNSDLFYCSPMYGSAFKVKYGAYIKKVEIDRGLDKREAENIVRQEKGVAKIGEKWINETLLFNYIDILFPECTVEREASPPWLGKQRLDIYISEIGLAIEYQGEQHFKAIDMFGGEDALKIARARDREKLSKCRANNVSLVYFTYKDDLSEKLVATRLKTYLNVGK